MQFYTFSIGSTMASLPLLVTRQYFSAVDSALAESWNKPFYIANPSATLHVFQRGDNTLAALEAGRLGLGSQADYAKGQPVLAENGGRARLATSLLASRDFY